MALTLAGNYSDASLIRAASGDIQAAIELLYFTRQDGMIKIGPYTTLIGEITQRLINQLLSEYSRKNNISITELKPLPNLALYFKLGTSDEEIKNMRQEMLKNQMEQVSGASGGKYLEYLQIYDQ